VAPRSRASLGPRRHRSNDRSKVRPRLYQINIVDRVSINYICLYSRMGRPVLLHARCIRFSVCLSVYSACGCLMQCITGVTSSITLTRPWRHSQPCEHYWISCDEGQGRKGLDWTGWCVTLRSRRVRPSVNRLRGRSATQRSTFSRNQSTSYYSVVVQLQSNISPPPTLTHSVPAVIQSAIDDAATILYVLLAESAESKTPDQLSSCMPTA